MKGEGDVLKSMVVHEGQGNLSISQYLPRLYTNILNPLIEKERAPQG